MEDVINNKNPQTTQNTIHIYNNNLIKDGSKDKKRSDHEFKIFDKINKESQMILSSAKPSYFVTQTPENPYTLFLWLLVILIIIFLIVEYINKDSKDIEY